MNSPTTQNPSKRGIPTGDSLASILLQLEHRNEFGLMRILTALDNTSNAPFAEVSIRANDLALIAIARLSDLKISL